jgi:hypothetical protein
MRKERTQHAVPVLSVMIGVVVSAMDELGTSNMGEVEDNFLGLGDRIILLNGDLNVTMFEQGDFLILNLCSPCIVLEKHQIQG